MIVNVLMENMMMEPVMIVKIVFIIVLYVLALEQPIVVNVKEIIENLFKINVLVQIITMIMELLIVQNVQLNVLVV